LFTYQLRVAFEGISEVEDAVNVADWKSAIEVPISEMILIP